MFHGGKVGTHGVNHVDIAVSNEEGYGCGVVQHVGEFILFGPEVQGDKYSPQFGYCVVRFKKLSAVDLQYGYHVSLLDAQLGQGVGQPV